jgi:membrane-associated protein
MFALTVPLLADGLSLSSIMDPAALLPALGGWVLAAVGAMVFIESGVLFPFLPGDSLVFTAGLLHGRLGLSLPVLMAVVVAAAALGDQAGYWLGRRFGRRLFSPGARVLKTEHLGQAEAFFDRHGGKALVLARFVPIVRTFAPLAAGAADYRYRQFLIWNLLGALLWGAGLAGIGSLLGGVQFIADNVELLALVIVAVSLLPAGAGLLRRFRSARQGSAARESAKAAGREQFAAGAAPAGTHQPTGTLPGSGEDA